LWWVKKLPTLISTNGYEGIVMILLEDNRIDPSVVNNNGSNCLHLSAMNRHDGIVQLLLDDGRVDPSVVNNFGYNCLSIIRRATIKKMLMDDTRLRSLESNVNH
jgi:ankyrin repeat protein